MDSGYNYSYVIWLPRSQEAAERETLFIDCEAVRHRQSPSRLQRSKRLLQTAERWKHQRRLQQHLIRRAGVLLGGFPQKQRILEGIGLQATSVRTKGRNDRAG